MSTWLRSLGHEPCHSLRMSASPGQGLGRVWGFLFVYFQLRADRLVALFAEQGGQEGRRTKLRQSRNRVQQARV